MKKEFKIADKEYFVKSPSPKTLQDAKRKYSAEFFKCLDEDIPTKDQAKARLKKCGIWTDDNEKEEKALVDKINEAELELYRGSENTKRISLADGKAKALEIKKLRDKYMSLISERQSYESNTAEAIADNARFDFLVSECVFNKDSTKVYNSYEDYQNRADEELAYESANHLAQMMYNLEDDFIKKLPENSFLSMFNLVDDKLRLIDKDGHLVDADGRKISEEGYYLNDDGNRVDINGNELTEEGLLKIDVVYLDDDGNEVVANSKVESESKTEEVLEETETNG